MIDMTNKKGGLDIGGEKYNIQLIKYDSNNSGPTAVSAANRLIFEDKVKFIISDMFFAASYLPIADANKVVVVTSPPSLDNLMPNLHYSFNPMGNNSQGVVATGWFCKNYPDAIKNVVAVSPDNQFGHMLQMILTPQWQAFGSTPNWIFFPAGVTDMSAMATKIASLKPTVLLEATGDSASSGLIMKAMYQGGWRGIKFSGSAEPAATLASYAGWDALDGFICLGMPQEFDPPLNQAAKDWLDTFVARYGKWEGQDGFAALYEGLTSAIQQAGSLDTDKVMAVVNNGMKFEGINGSFLMISRPDLGNNRTVDSVSITYIKEITGGKVKLLSTISLDEAIGYLQQLGKK
jgi:branched-chain amino acid transport system substrate-binding protein